MYVSVVSVVWPVGVWKTHNWGGIEQTTYPFIVDNLTYFGAECQR